MDLDREADERVAQIALRTLRACETSDSVVAGRRHFVQHWLRDACFAHWGHLALDEHERVERALAYFTSGIDGEGRVPLRYGNPNMFWPALADLLSGFRRYDARDPERSPRYGDDKRDSEAIDSTPLLVLLAGLHALSGGEVPSGAYDSMERAMRRLETRERFGLLWQTPYADWCDSIKRRGYVTYTNALYYGALRSMSLLAPDAKRKDAYAERAQEVRALINERLWTTSHYAEYTTGNEEIRVYSVESNALAALLGVSNARQTKLLFETFDRHASLTEWIGRRVAPLYAQREISTAMTLLSMREYHRRIQWLWTSGLVLIATRQLDPNEARRERVVTALDRLLADKAWVSEAYLHDREFRTWWYKTEEPFAWSSGMLIAGLAENERLDRAFARIRGSR